MTQLSVSVIVATYQGADRITRCLHSLAMQDLPHDQFEVVVVQNGPADTTPEVIDGVRAIFPSLRIRTVTVADPGAGQARNVGLLAARGQYVTFVDDDDHVSREFLRTMLAHSKPNVVGLGYLASVTGAPDDPPNFKTGATLQLVHNPGVVPARLVSSALGYTAAKMVSTELARSVLFDPALRSGEDVVFWTQILAKSGFKFGVVPVEEHAIYFREVRANSVSRQALSYEFNVTQRLDVLERLEALPNLTNLDVAEVVRRMTDGQLGFIRRYLRQAPERYGDIIAEIAKRQLTIDLSSVKRGAARDLAVLYVALPYNDTSSLVAARRLRAAGAIVDVVSSDMSALRDLDESAVAIWEDFVDQVAETDTKPSSAHWPGITDFVWKGMAAIEGWEAEKGKYRRLYSRAMWPASHLLAALYKIRNPDVIWTAEFSDPLIHDIKGEVRQSNGAVDKDLLEEFREAMIVNGFKAPSDENMYVWVESLAYALADRMLFTNEHQRSYMLSYFEDEKLRDRAAAHSEIAPHPTLPERFYHLRPCPYVLDEKVVNIGYFGVFYATRGLTEVVNGLKAMRPELRAKVRLHIFTPKPDELRDEAKAAGIGDVVIANSYVSYLEFLNLTTKFDALLVNDTRTLDTHDVNPYLPSKYSDYSGSGRPVWGVIEPKSILSQQPLEYVSELGDVDGARDVLERLAATK